MEEMWSYVITGCVTCLQISSGAHLSVAVEKSHGLTRDHNHQRPADLLVTGWDRGRPAAMDITVTSPNSPVILGELCQVVGAAALAAENRKRQTNGPKCQELGWACTPLAVETYGNWGEFAQGTFSSLASHLAISLSKPKAIVLTDLYDRLNLNLVKSIARALLARELRLF